jgi:hypothetical protein
VVGIIGTRGGATVAVVQEDVAIPDGAGCVPVLIRQEHISSSHSSKRDLALIGGQEDIPISNRAEHRITAVVNKEDISIGNRPSRLVSVVVDDAYCCGLSKRRADAKEQNRKGLDHAEAASLPRRKRQPACISGALAASSVPPDWASICHFAVIVF